MEQINMLEIERKIGYWQHMLSKIEEHMLKEQSERVDMKQRLEHLHHLQQQVVLEEKLVV